MRLFALFAVSLFVFACGAKNLPDVSGKKKVDNQPVKGCPVAPSDFHQITLKFSHALPAKLGLKMDNDTDFRLNECLPDLAQRGPKATMVRDRGNQITIQVDHNNAFEFLPTSTTFEVFDMQGCGTTVQSYFKTPQPVQLRWKQQFPNGASCAGRKVADYTISAVIEGDEAPVAEAN
ncbi:MAG TPA: hypothetical protein VIH99_06285 [Bdellovibrionota bacterium]